MAFENDKGKAKCNTARAHEGNVVSADVVSERGNSTKV